MQVRSVVLLWATAYGVVPPLLSGCAVRHRRGVTVSVATFFMSAFSVVLNGTLLTTVGTFGASATFGGYGVVYALCWLFLALKLPETSNRDLGSATPAPSPIGSSKQHKQLPSPSDDGTSSAI